MSNAILIKFLIMFFPHTAVWGIFFLITVYIFFKLFIFIVKS